MSLLSIKNLHATVGGNEILKGINLEIGPGEIHAVMGPNGSGKSTLSYVLAGREGYEVTKGTISFKGKDLIDLAADERAKAVETAHQKLQQTEAAYEIDKRKRLNTTVPKEVARSAALAAKHAQEAALEAEPDRAGLFTTWISRFLGRLR